MSTVWRVYGYQGIPEGYRLTIAVVRMLSRVVRVSYDSHHISDEGPRRLGRKLGVPEALLRYNLQLREGISSVALRTIGSTLLFGWFSPLSPLVLSGHTD